MIKLLEHRVDRVQAMFALATEITSVERREGGGGRQRQRRECEGRHCLQRTNKEVLQCVSRERGGAENVGEAERVLQKRKKLSG